MDKSGFLVQKLFTCCCLQSKHTQTLRKQWRKWKYVQHDESDIQWSVKEEDDMWCCGCYGFLMYGRMRMLLVVPGPGREPHTKTTAWCGLRSSCSSPKRIANWSRLWMSCSHCDAFASETHTRWLWFFGDWTTGECGRLSQPSFLAHYKIISITYLLAYLLMGGSRRTKLYLSIWEWCWCSLVDQATSRQVMSDTANLARALHQHSLDGVTRLSPLFWPSDVDMGPQFNCITPEPSPV